MPFFVISPFAVTWTGICSHRCRIICSAVSTFWKYCLINRPLLLALRFALDVVIIQAAFVILSMVRFRCDEMKPAVSYSTWSHAWKSLFPLVEKALRENHFMLGVLFSGLYNPRFRSWIEDVTRLPHCCSRIFRARNELVCILVMCTTIWLRLFPLASSAVSRRWLNCLVHICFAVYSGHMMVILRMMMLLLAIRYGAWACANLFSSFDTWNNIVADFLFC